MKLSDEPPATWVILGLVLSFAGIQGFAWYTAGGVPTRPLVLVQVIAAWIVIVVLAILSLRRIGALSRRLTVHQRKHREVLDEVEQLQMHNAMLQSLARSVDVPLAFHGLADRIARLVPCDRLGMALLSEDGREFQTYTARTVENDRRSRPRPEVMFRMDRTLIGTVVRTREPMIIDDVDEIASDFLDANVLQSAGFRSAVVLPLISSGRAVGTLNAVSRRRHAFSRVHLDALKPIAELFAVARVAQQLQMTLGKYRTMEAMAELTLSTSAEINSALQTIIGQCDLLERSSLEATFQRDIAIIVHQARRISDLLENMRAAADERLREIANAVRDGTTPQTSNGKFDREVL